MKFKNNQSKILDDIIVSRRDIRGNNFKSKKIKKKKINKILEAGLNAPSVGFSQPWKFVVIKDKKIKNNIYKNFKKEYKKSKKYFKNRPIYKTLKLEGIKETPINIAVYYKKSKTKILGQTTQKAMGKYSVVCAIQNMWLMARSLNIGIGWVSIIKPKKVNKLLNLSDDYKLVGYLCVGYPKKFLDSPELELLKWDKKRKFKEVVSFK
ncbi:MAG: 5,6-dimethylbenzimidazole synthase [Campylobacterota bacterium]|nr:5,6-dimethylbenzimidazole synthase [Campylobacterota bacterium]